MPPNNAKCDLQVLGVSLIDSLTHSFNDINPWKPSLKLKEYAEQHGHNKQMSL